jgi:phosphatidylserine decarboxylase
MIRTAPEGRWFIASAWVITLVLVLVAFRAGTVAWWIATVIWGALSVWVIAFFRDPHRAGDRGAHLVVAPADGKVVSIVEVYEPSFMTASSQRISIFMNVFDVHVNRYPVDGTVAYRHYNPGKFGHAGTEKSSQDNEQSSIGLDTSRGRVLVRQIAGLVARRIVTDHAVGTPVRQGDRLGMIRFGSRVDLFVPSDATILVRVGDRTQAGVTVVAQWN